LSAIAAITWVCLAVAQEREPARPAAPGARPAAAAPAAGARVVAAPTADQQIAALLYNCCRNEIEISKFAQDKLQSPEAQKFAERMVAEHEAACQKLAKFAGPALEGNTRLDVIPGAGRPARVEGREDAREERREGREEAREERREEGAAEAREERREGREEAREEVREAREEAREAVRDAAEAPRPARPAARVAGQTEVELKAGGDRTRPEVEVRLGGRGGAAGGLNWVSIHKQIADQCLASTKQEFAAKEGHELDRCYLGGQIMGHMKAIDEIKVLRSYASPELRAELDECSQHCTEHLMEAKALAKRLEGEAPRVSRKPEGADEATKPE
jgi:predicted outer membrane protein